MRSVMKHRFSEIPQAEIPRSSFDRSFGHKTTFDAGKLYPILVDEAVPGDTFNVNMSAFCRMNTPINPVMDNVYLDSHFFAVPMRLVWDNWEKFNGAQDDPGDSTDFTIPTFTADTFVEGELLDYMGIPPGVAFPAEISCLYARAYALIWNEWFRDQNMQNSISVATGDGPDFDHWYPIKSRGKRHDYFTSCLPWPQKGDDVVVGLLGTAPVTGIGYSALTTAGAGPYTAWETGGGASASYADVVNSTMRVEEDPSNAGYPNIYADLSAATGVDINDLRLAFQTQKLLERDARGGTRYTEIVKSHFGVTSPDARLQRPEYLGGGTSAVNITPVPQTSSTDATTPQGNLSAYGTVGASGHGFVKSFTEHCIIIGLVSVRADLTYQQGINRMFSRSTRYDFYWPALSMIGEQAVLNKEIYADGSANDDLVFGYQERYGEMRYKPSLISGKMRSGATGTLDPWHLSQEFSALPTLGDTFITENPPMDRVMALTTEPDFIGDFYFDMKCARPMPLFGTPGMLDRF
jgi:hypothetical protein